jgi:hypothetical protein
MILHRRGGGGIYAVATLATFAAQVYLPFTVSYLIRLMECARVCQPQGVEVGRSLKI